MATKRSGKQYKDLKNNLKALFDEAGSVVKKEIQTSTKQADRIHEEPLATMLSEKAYDILEQEKERTGEDLSAILEKAIINLRTQTPATSRQEVVVGEDYESQILNRMVAMRDNKELSFDEIARQFNREGLKTFSGKGQWHGITISAMYERFKEI